jgi:hypothetical protein
MTTPTKLIVLMAFTRDADGECYQGLRSARRRIGSNGNFSCTIDDRF